MDHKERRGSVRIDSRMEIQLRADAIRAEGFIDDISEAGVWVDTLQPLPVGTDVVFQFYLLDTDPDTPVSGNATVVRSEANVGMALKFGYLDPKAAERIRFYVAAMFFGQNPAELP